MNKSHRILLIEFWIPIIVCFCMIVLYENDFILSGGLQGDTMTEYRLAIAMELITICFIPVSLRLFRFKSIKCALEKEKANALIRWGSVRILMLALPMVVNCGLYYQFMNVAFGYLGIIGLLSMIFIYPSKMRCVEETKNDTQEKK